MKHSEFWANVDEVFGSAYGRSLVSDLALEPWFRPAIELLDSGVDPQKIWEALVDGTGQDPELKWFHRQDKRRAATK